MPGERGHGAFAIGAGHRQYLGPVLPGEELDVAQHRNPPSSGFHDQRLAQRQAGAHAHHIRRVEQAQVERSAMQLARVVGRARWGGAGVGDARLAALPLHPAGDRESGVAEPEHQHAQAAKRPRRGSLEQRESGLAHHLSLSVDSPNSTSIMVMIQKRTTTWLSFQPSSS